MKLCISFALIAASALWAADPVPMDVKTGEWETTTTTKISGFQVPPLPEDQLAKMPPEQRARLEAIMKQATNRTTTVKGCLKEKDLTQLRLNENKDCKTSLVSSSRTKQVIHLDCDINGVKQVADMTYEALSSESVKFSVNVAGQATGIISGTSKWLSSTCTDK